MNCAFSSTRFMGRVADTDFPRLQTAVLGNRSVTLVNEKIFFIKVPPALSDLRGAVSFIIFCLCLLGGCARGLGSKAPQSRFSSAVKIFDFGHSTDAIASRDFISA